MPLITELIPFSSEDKFACQGISCHIVAISRIVNRVNGVSDRTLNNRMIMLSLFIEYVFCGHPVFVRLLQGNSDCVGQGSALNSFVFHFNGA